MCDRAGRYMTEHEDPLFFNVDISNPIDNALDQIEISASNVQLKEGRAVDPVTTAALLLKSRAVRLEHFQDRQPEIDDIGWHILLDLMVSTNMEKPVAMHDLATTHNLAMNTVSRYVRYLSRIGLIDKDIEAEAEQKAPLKLTASGDVLIRAALHDISQELANF